MLGGNLTQVAMIQCITLFDGIFCGHNMMCPPVIYTDIYLSLGTELDIALTIYTLARLEAENVR